MNDNDSDPADQKLNNRDQKILQNPEEELKINPFRLKEEKKEEIENFEDKEFSDI